VATYDNDKILRHSSSGGIFTALSKIILNDGGIVFGAAFDKNWRVYHTSAENLDELENLRGSKYVQSQIGAVYRQVKEALKSRKVLFSGVPCQCAALKHFLGKDYDNLLTVEILCHGVPSPALWESYVAEIGYSHEIAHINFRTKRKGWQGKIYTDINFSDQGHMITPVSNHLYGRLFLRNLSLRPSCSACKFRFPNGLGDLVIGDAWGVGDFCPEMTDKRGTSVIFIYTAKGKDFFERANLKSKQVNFVEATKKNRVFIQPTMVDSRRKDFFAELAESKDWFAVMQKYFANDDEAIRKDTDKRNGASYRKNLQAILAQVRQKFEKNILVFAAPREKVEQDNLETLFDKQFQNCGVYFFQTVEDKIVCKENFSKVNLEQADFAALSDFVKKFNVTEIFVEEPLNFDLPAAKDWIKVSNLPVQKFTSAGEELKVQTAPKKIQEIAPPIQQRVEKNISDVAAQGKTLIERVKSQKDSESFDFAGELDFSGFSFEESPIVQKPVEKTEPRPKFEKNILLVASPRQEGGLERLENLFTKQFKNYGVYSIQFAGDKIICRETFSGVAYEQADLNSLSVFVKQFNITEILVENPLNFDSPNLANWLASCKLPVNPFYLNA